jgi:hypothetical protein
MEDIQREVSNISKTLRDFVEVYMKAHNILNEAPKDTWGGTLIKNFEDHGIVEIVPNLYLSGLLLCPPENVYRRTMQMVVETNIGAVLQLSAANTRFEWINRLRDPNMFLQIQPFDETISFEDMYRSCAFIDEKLKLGKRVCIVGCHRKGVASQMIIAYLMFSGFPFEMAYKTLATRSPGSEPSSTGGYINDAKECLKKRKRDTGEGTPKGRPRKIQPTDD